MPIQRLATIRTPPRNAHVVPLCCLAALALASGARAQEADPRSTGTALGEVVVTASKREESIQSVPVTVTAFSADDLARRGMDDFEKYAQFVPGFDFQKQGVSQSQYVIRGATVGRVLPAEPQNRSLVGLYLNDIPLDLNGLNPDLDLFDTRVEVLKGPQGSLFGDSAMAGAVRYVTLPADPTAFGARLLANVGSFEDGGTNYAVKGMLNLPVTDTLAVRLVGAWRDDAGWVDNVLTGERDTNTQKTDAGRLGVRWSPRENVTLDVLALHQRTRGGTPPYDTDAPATDGLGGRAQFARAINEAIEDTLDLGAATLEVRLPAGTLTSVTSYQERDLDNSLVELADALNLFYFGSRPSSILLHEWRTSRFTQELRFATELQGRVNATAGLYFSRQKIEFYNLGLASGFEAYALANDLFGLAPDQASYDALGCADIADAWYCGPEIDTVKQRAAFGELYVDLTDRLRLTLGGRYYRYDLDYFQDFGGLINFGRYTKETSSNDSGFNPKAALAFRLTDDVLLYGNVAKGYRLGGISNALPAFCNADLAAVGLTADQVDSYRPDKLWSGELGAKTRSLGGRLILNGSVYFTRWNDIQTPINLACGYIPTTNAGRVDAKGVEGQATLAATDALTLSFSFAVNDSELAGPAPSLGGVDGDRVPYAPRFKGVVGADYQRPLGGGVALAASTDLRYSTLAYDTFTQDNEIPAQFVGNLRIGALFRDRYRVSLFVDNFTDEDVVTQVRTRFGLTTRYIGRPRTIGVEFAADFD